MCSSAIWQLLELRLFGVLGALWAFSVVGSGALMFFLMCGLHTLPPAAAEW